MHAPDRAENVHGCATGQACTDVCLCVRTGWDTCAVAYGVCLGLPDHVLVGDVLRFAESVCILEKRH